MKIKNENKKNWANAEDYERAYNFLQEEGANPTSYHRTRELLNSIGLELYVVDWKDWLETVSDTNKASVAKFAKKFG